MGLILPGQTPDDKASSASVRPILPGETPTREMPETGEMEISLTSLDNGNEPPPELSLLDKAKLLMEAAVDLNSANPVMEAHQFQMFTRLVGGATVFSEIAAAEAQVETARSLAEIAKTLREMNIVR